MAGVTGIRYRLADDPEPFRPFRWATLEKDVVEMVGRRTSERTVLDDPQQRIVIHQRTPSIGRIFHIVPFGARRLIEQLGHMLDWQFTEAERRLASPGI